MTFDDVIDHFGSRYMACKALGIANQNFTHWQNRGYIPIKHQFSIEELTKGKLKADSAADYMNAIQTDGVSNDKLFKGRDMDEILDYEMGKSCLSNAIIEDEEYVRGNFDGSTFSNCDFSYVLFKYPNLRQCTFSECTFNHVRFYCPKELILSKFVSCKLESVEFIGVESDELEFTGCDLKDVKILEK